MINKFFFWIMLKILVNNSCYLYKYTMGVILLSNLLMLKCHCSQTLYITLLTTCI